MEKLLEEKVDELEKLLAPEKEMERADLAMAVSEAFRASFNKWLINKHGSKKLPDGTEVPLKYSVGDYDKDEKKYKFIMRDVDDLLDYTAENMLGYIFHDVYENNPENFKTIKKAMKDAGLLQGIFQKFGVNADKFKEILTDNPQNIFTKDVEGAIKHAGTNFATAEVQEAAAEVKKYGLDLKEKLYGLAEKKFGERGYGIKTKGMAPEDVINHLTLLYSGKYEPEKAPGSKVYKKTA